MTYRLSNPVQLLVCGAVLAALVLFDDPVQLQAQVTLRPSLGLQTITFNGAYPVSQPISPGPGQSERLGGGIVGPQSGVRLQFEIFDEEKDALRFPLSFEYYSLNGRTTFSLASGNLDRKQRLTFVHSAQILSGGLGAMIIPFDLPSVYFQAEAKANYIPASNLNARIFYADNGETIQENDVEASPDVFRVGAYVSIGAQMEFFEPFLLDFSLGYGALNLFGRVEDPDSGRQLLIVDPINQPEVTIGYVGLNMSLVWKL